MAFYIILYLIVVLSLVLTRNKLGRHKFVFFVIIAALVLIFGFRQGVGSDYNSYVFLYDKYGLSIHSTRLEIGFKFITETLIDSGADVKWFFFTFFLITLSLIASSIRTHLNRYDLAMACLIGLSLVFFFCNGVRQGVAVSIALFSFQFIRDRRIYLYLLSIFIAFLFHSSVLFFLPAYLIAFVRVKNLYFYIFLITSFLLSTFASHQIISPLVTIWESVATPDLATRYDGIVERTEFGLTQGRVLGHGMRLIIMNVVVIFVVHTLSLSAHPGSKTILPLIVFSQIYYNIFSGYSGLFRFWYYYGVLLVVAIPMAVEQFRGKAIFRMIQISIHAVVFFLFLRALDINHHNVIPYSHVFEPIF